MVHPHACGEHLLHYPYFQHTPGSSPRMWGTRFPQKHENLYDRFIPTHVGNTWPQSRLPHRISVHPHACGEHSCLVPYLLVCFGSSPRMWGTQPTHQQALGLSRFIPTHVGNTGPTRPALAIQPVHPHACGEHSHHWGGLGTIYGSSPRMWGTRPISSPENILFRFIPTHVGNTIIHRVLLIRFTVHPHACGEHSFRFCFREF